MASGDPERSRQTGGFASTWWTAANALTAARLGLAPVMAYALLCGDTVLALGGSVAPSEVFEAFRGRAPTPDALLRHAGLEAKTAA